MRDINQPHPHKQLLTLQHTEQPNWMQWKGSISALLIKRVNYLQLSSHHSAVSSTSAPHMESHQSPSTTIVGWMRHLLGSLAHSCYNSEITKHASHVKEFLRLWRAQNHPKHLKVAVRTIRSYFCSPHPVRRRLQDRQLNHRSSPGLPHFTVVTDHHPLIPILNNHWLDEIENLRMQHLKTGIIPYNFTAEWINVAQKMHQMPYQGTLSPTLKHMRCSLNWTQTTSKSDPLGASLATTPT